MSESLTYPEIDFQDGNGRAFVESYTHDRNKSIVERAFQQSYSHAQYGFRLPGSEYLYLTCTFKCRRGATLFAEIVESYGRRRTGFSRQVVFDNRTAQNFPDAWYYKQRVAELTITPGSAYVKLHAAVSPDPAFTDQHTIEMFFSDVYSEDDMLADFTALVYNAPATDLYSVQPLPLQRYQAEAWTWRNGAIINQIQNPIARPQSPTGFDAGWKEPRTIAHLDPTPAPGLDFIHCGNFWQAFGREAEVGVLGRGPVHDLFGAFDVERYVPAGSAFVAPLPFSHSIDGRLPRFAFKFEPTVRPVPIGSASTNYQTTDEQRVLFFSFVAPFLSGFEGVVTQSAPLIDVAACWYAHRTLIGMPRSTFGQREGAFNFGYQEPTSLNQTFLRIDRAGPACSLYAQRGRYTVHDFCPRGLPEATFWNTFVTIGKSC